MRDTNHTGSRRGPTGSRPLFAPSDFNDTYCVLDGASTSLARYGSTWEGASWAHIGFRSSLVRCREGNRNHNLQVLGVGWGLCCRAAIWRSCACRSARCAPVPACPSYLAHVVVGLQAATCSAEKLLRSGPGQLGRSPSDMGQQLFGVQDAEAFNKVLSLSPQPSSAVHNPQLRTRSPQGPAPSASTRHGTSRVQQGRPVA